MIKIVTVAGNVEQVTVPETLMSGDFAEPEIRIYGQKEIPEAQAWITHAPSRQN